MCASKTALVASRSSQRPTLSELNRVVGEQSLIMESLCSEHLLGRWIWKSGRTRGEKHAVPWNVQNINTNPDNFMWTQVSGHSPDEVCCDWASFLSVAAQTDSLIVCRSHRTPQALLARRQAYTKSLLGSSRAKSPACSYL